MAVNIIVPRQSARVEVADANYTITGTGDQLIAYTSISADRTLNLPPATTANQRIVIIDESGLCSAVRRILAVPNGSDTFGGDVFGVINFPAGGAEIESNGAGKWTVISTTSIQLSAGVSVLPTFTDLGTGSVLIGTGVYVLFANADFSGRPKAYQIAGGTFALTDGTTNYICAKYDTTGATVSIIQTTNIADITGSTVVPIFSIYRQGLTLHPLNFDRLALGLSNKIQRSFERTNKFRVERGEVLLGETTGRIITVTGGTAWVGGIEVELSAVASNVQTCYFVHHTAGVWTTTDIVTQYNNTQYDDGTGLVTLTNNRYAVNFIYRSIGDDNDIAIVLGQGDYTLGQAQVATVPLNLPNFITTHMNLVGRIIVQKSAVTATQIDSAFDSIIFTSAGVTDHEALNNLLGGTTNEHYHLTAAQYADNAYNTPRVQTVTSSATVTPTSLDDEVVITAQAAALLLANPSGTSGQGQVILIRIKDNGTARAITYGSEYRAIGFTLPSTTVLSKTLYLAMVRNTTDTKWDVLSAIQEL